MTNLTGFTGRTENAFAGSFSPDGKQIVFRIESGDTYSLARHRPRRWQPPPHHDR